MRLAIRRDLWTRYRRHGHSRAVCLSETTQSPPPLCLRCFCACSLLLRLLLLLLRMSVCRSLLLLRIIAISASAPASSSGHRPASEPISTAPALLVLRLPCARSACVCCFVRTCCACASLAPRHPRLSVCLVLCHSVAAGWLLCS